MTNKYLKERRSMKLIFLEHAVTQDRLKKYDNFLSDTTNAKNNLKELNILINDLKKEIKKLDSFDIEITDKDENSSYYICNFSLFATNLIFKIIEISNKNKNDEKIQEIIFPEGDIIKHKLFPKIEIETKNFNRIHINDIPMIIRNIGVGKKIYKTMIEKLSYISSNHEDRSIAAELVWTSIIEDKNIYSFICKEKIISFSHNYEYEKIINTLKEFFRYELENYPNEIIIDNDFEEKYKINKI
jgi:hypothetical protein